MSLPPPLPNTMPMIRGPHFTYQLPQGWSVGEEGNFALVLRSPDFMASIVVFGQSGLMQPMSPAQFAYQSMANVMRLAPDIRFANVQPVPPMPGYTHAERFETTYTVHTPQGPVPICGVVVANVAVGFGQCNGTLTLAGSAAHQWNQYSSWLPRIALSAVNTGPNPYGSAAMAQTISGIAQQDHNAYQAYQSWSQQTWQAVVDQRAASIDQQQTALDPMLTGQQWHADPYGGGHLRRSTSPAVIWRSRDGREISSPDPSFDPRTPTDSDWLRVQ